MRLRFTERKRITAVAVERSGSGESAAILIACGYHTLLWVFFFLFFYFIFLYLRLGKEKNFFFSFFFTVLFEILMSVKFE